MIQCLRSVEITLKKPCASARRSVSDNDIRKKYEMFCQTPQQRWALAGQDSPSGNHGESWPPVRAVEAAQVAVYTQKTMMMTQGIELKWWWHGMQ